MANWRTRKCPHCDQLRTTKNGHSWCADCKKNAGEKTMRKFAEHIKKEHSKGGF